LLEKDLSSHIFPLETVILIKFSPSKILWRRLELHIQFRKRWGIRVVFS